MCLGLTRFGITQLRVIIGLLDDVLWCTIFPLTRFYDLFFSFLVILLPRLFIPSKLTSYSQVVDQGSGTLLGTALSYTEKSKGLINMTHRRFLP